MPNVCEHVFVSIKGGSYARFRQALETGNLTLVRAAAAELPRVNLDDALRVCLLLRSADAALYERSAIRWLGRFALEHQGRRWPCCTRQSRPSSVFPTIPRQRAASWWH